MDLCIAYYGRQSSGKTSTLNRVIDLLKNDSSHYSHHQSFGTDAELFKSSNGKLVLVCVNGDSADKVKDNCIKAENENVDVVVLPTHCQGETVDELHRHYNDSQIYRFRAPRIEDSKFFSGNVIPSARNEVNNQCAMVIKSLLDDVC